MPTSESGVYMITAKDINHGKIQVREGRAPYGRSIRNLLTAKSRPKKGDLLLLKMEHWGRLPSSTTEEGVFTSLLRFCPKNSKAVTEFLKILLELHPTRIECSKCESGGSTIKHIYITIYTKCPWLSPQPKPNKKLSPWR